MIVYDALLFWSEFECVVIFIFLLLLLLLFFGFVGDGSTNFNFLSLGVRNYNQFGLDWS